MPYYSDSAEVQQSHYDRALARVPNVVLQERLDSSIATIETLRADLSDDYIAAILIDLGYVRSFYWKDPIEGIIDLRCTDLQLCALATALKCIAITGDPDKWYIVDETRHEVAKKVLTKQSQALMQHDPTGDEFGGIMLECGLYSYVQWEDFIVQRIVFSDALTPLQVCVAAGAVACGLEGLLYGPL